MKVNVAIIVQRDDGVNLTYHVPTVGNDQGWVGNKRRRLTKAELRKALDARIAAALSSMGVK